MPIFFVKIVFLSVLVALCLPAHSSTEYLIIGEIFYDKNKNAVRDAGEWGIGGIEILIDEKISILSEEDGRFQTKFLTSNFFSNIRVNKMTLPPGSFIVGSPDETINIERGRVHKIDFAVYYPTEIIVIPLKEEELFSYALNLDKKTSLKVEKKEKGIYLGEKRKQLVYPLDEFEKKLFFSPSTLELERPSARTISFLKDSIIESIEIQSPVNIDRQSKRILELEISRLTDQKVSVSTKENLSLSKIKASLKGRLDSDCFLLSGKEKKALKKNHLIEHVVDNDRKSQFALNCIGSSLGYKDFHFSKLTYKTQKDDIGFKNLKTYDLELEKGDYIFFEENKETQLKKIDLLSDFNQNQLFFTIINKAYNFDMKTGLSFDRDYFVSKLKRKKLPRVEFVLPKYYQDSLWPYTFFKVSTFYSKNVMIEGKPLNKSQSLIKSTTKKLNSVKIQAEVESTKEIINKEFEFKNFYNKHNYLNISQGYYNSSRESSVFGIEYSIDSIQFYRIDGMYFFGDTFGVYFNYEQDITNTMLSSTSATEVSGSRKSFGIGSMMNLNFFPKNYFSSNHYAFARYISKTSSYDSEDTTVFLPEDLGGLQFGLFSQFKYLPTFNYNWTTELSYTKSFNHANDYMIKAKLNFLIDLNVVSDILNWSDYFSYYNRNSLWEKFSLVPSIEYQLEERTISNFNTGTLTHNNLIYSLGLSVHF